MRWIVDIVLFLDRVMVAVAMAVLTAIAVVLLTLILVLSVLFGMVRQLMVSLHPNCSEAECGVRRERIP